MVIQVIKMDKRIHEYFKEAIEDCNRRIKYYENEMILEAKKGSKAARIIKSYLWSIEMTEIQRQIYEDDYEQMKEILGE